MTESGKNDPSVTVVITRLVKPGCQVEFEDFLKGVSAACMEFPGHLGTTIFRPTNPLDLEYRIIFKFDRLSHLRNWEQSETRQAWFAVAEKLTQSPPKIEIINGLETWLELPNQSVTPPKYKMAIISWLVVFPLIAIISTALGAFPTELHPLLKTFIITAISAPTMTYLFMPKMTQLFAKWLHSK
jgi:antibiotic biosynthesis monooxygenase (ABM) superfamily enzyme